MRRPAHHTLAIFRKTIGFSQKEMAELLGCSRETIQSIERGRRRLNPGLARRAELMTNVSSKWLRANDTSKPPLTREGTGYSEAVFAHSKAVLFPRHRSAEESSHHLLKTWDVFIEHVRLLTVLYIEAYKSDKVWQAFCVGVLSANENLKTTVNSKSRIQLVTREGSHIAFFKLKGDHSEPEFPSDLAEILDSFEAATREELRRKLQQNKGQICGKYPPPGPLLPANQRGPKNAKLSSR
jgi:transcriptional regulator with XRE-family HTH domain